MIDACDTCAWTVIEVYTVTYSVDAGMYNDDVQVLKMSSSLIILDADSWERGAESQTQIISQSSWGKSQSEFLVHGWWSNVDDNKASTLSWAYTGCLTYMYLPGLGLCHFASCFLKKIVWRTNYVFIHNKYTVILNIA